LVSVYRSTSIGVPFVIFAVGLFLSFTGCNSSDSETTTASRISLREKVVHDTTKDLAPSGSELLKLIDQTLEFNRDARLLSVDRNAAWQVAHGAVAYGNELKLVVDGQTVPALEYLFQGGDMRGWELSTGANLPATGRPSIQAYVEAGSYVGQGHVDQFLGYLSQTGLPLNTPILVGDQTLKIEDWARTAQYQIPNNPYREYSWTLIALTTLLPTEPSWKAAD